MHMLRSLTTYSEEMRARESPNHLIYKHVDPLGTTASAWKTGQQPNTSTTRPAGRYRMNHRPHSFECMLQNVTAKAGMQHAQVRCAPDKPTHASRVLPLSGSRPRPANMHTCNVQICLYIRNGPSRNQVVDRCFGIVPALWPQETTILRQPSALAHTSLPPRCMRARASDRHRVCTHQDGPHPVVHRCAESTSPYPPPPAILEQKEMSRPL